MRMSSYPWNLHALASGKPSIGWLMGLCEENYRFLLQMAPGMRELEGQYLSRLNGSMDLYLGIIEQTPYTSLIHLTYYFSHETGQQPDPDATIRIYYDSRQAEILDLKQNVLPLNRGIQHPTLEQKWKVNLFLSKWLSYSIREGYSFNSMNQLSLQTHGEKTRSVA